MPRTLRSATRSLAGLACALITFSAHAHADAAADVSPSPLAKTERQPSRLQSHVAFGYGVESHATRGYHQAGGSLLAFDVAYRLFPEWRLGLRTMGSGAEEAGQRFYRMASGPLVIYDVNADWRVHASLGVFSETGYQSGTAAYHARGLSYAAGWQRNFALTSSASLGIGGFMAWNQGAWTAAALVPAASGAQSGSQRSLTRAITINLEMPLL